MKRILVYGAKLDRFKVLRLGEREVGVGYILRGNELG